MYIRVLLIIILVLLLIWIALRTQSIPQIHRTISHCEMEYYDPQADYTNRRGALRSLLFEFDDICQDNDIQYWIIEGSLLGQYRTRTLIPWDQDLDIGMLREDFEKLCQVSLDYHEMKRWKHNNSGRFIDKSNGMFIDVQIFWHKDDGWTCRWDTHKKYMADVKAGILHRPPGGIWPEEILLPLATCILEGRKFLCPRNTEAYLKIRYHDLEPDHYWDGNQWTKK